MKQLLWKWPMIFVSSNEPGPVSFIFNKLDHSGINKKHAWATEIRTMSFLGYVGSFPIDKNLCFVLASNIIAGFVVMTILTITCEYGGQCQDDFYFRKWPVSPQGIIRTGQTVELECRVSAEDRISISWTLNNQLLFNSSRRYQNGQTGDLVIRRADHRLDSGSFACTATNISSGFSIASQPATLMIQCK